MVNQPLETYTFRISETGETQLLEFAFTAVVIHQDNESWDTSNHCTNEETDSSKVQYLKVLAVLVFYQCIHCHVGSDSQDKEYSEQHYTITVEFRHD